MLEPPFSIIIAHLAAENGRRRLPSEARWLVDVHSPFQPGIDSSVSFAKYLRFIFKFINSRLPPPPLLPQFALPPPARNER